MCAPLYLSGTVGESITDGPGLRFTIFTQGCSHHCEGCHNPQTWAFEGGTPHTPQALFEEIQKNPLVRGVTLSGGEPLEQAEAFIPLAHLLKDAGYEIAVYTGFTFEELLAHGTPAQKQLLALCDILIDGKFVLAQRDLSLRFKGSRNQRILNLPQSFEKGEAVLEQAERWATV